MNTEKQIQYMSKVLSALNTLFDKESENYIGLEELQEGENMNDFFHIIATRAPQHIYTKFTGQEVDPLELNHIATRLIFQDRDSK
ncbi:hypothetical protein [Flavobacterium beibuense]|uniref:hypothetical protein n=1 Tax=Flavobacterium beibuense TaxID=657326 RepID=UPI003A91DBCD